MVSSFSLLWAEVFPHPAAQGAPGSRREKELHSSRLYISELT